MVGGLFVSELSESTNRVAEFTPVMLLVTLFLSKIWKVQNYVEIGEKAIKVVMK